MSFFPTLLCSLPQPLTTGGTGGWKGHPHPHPKSTAVFPVHHSLYRSMTLGRDTELQVESGACELCRGRPPYEGWCRLRGRRASGAGQLCCSVRAALQPDCLLCPPQPLLPEG